MIAISLSFLAMDNAIAMTCSRDIVSAQSSAHANGLYLYQEDYLDVTLVKPSSKIRIMNDIESLATRSARTGENNVLSVFGRKPYCLFFLHTGDATNNVREFRFGFFLASHYRLFAGNTQNRIVFSNFGMGESVTLTKEEFDKIRNSEGISREKRRKVDRMLFSISDVEGNAIDSAVSGDIFRRLFLIPETFDNLKYEHVFEFTRFKQYQDSVTRVLVKEFTRRSNNAFDQTTLISILSPFERDFGTPKFWVVKFELEDIIE